MRFYRISALLGTLIILMDVGIMMMRIQDFESNVSEVFESRVLVKMELDSIEQELEHVNKVLEQGKTDGDSETAEVEGVVYTSYEVERLRNEQKNLELFVREKQLYLDSLDRQKKFIMNEVRILFMIALIFLVIGTLFAAFGYLAWYFKVELFEDRRKKPR